MNEKILSIQSGLASRIPVSKSTRCPYIKALTGNLCSNITAECNRVRINCSGMLVKWSYYPYDDPNRFLNELNPIDPSEW